MYAPNHYRENEPCWNTIKETLNETQNGKIILGGDLNLVRNIEEKFGGSYHTDLSMDALETIMEQHNLMDIPQTMENIPRATKEWEKKHKGKIRQNTDARKCSSRLQISKIKNSSYHGL